MYSDLEMYVFMCLICGFQHKFSSIWTPKNFVLSSLQSFPVRSRFISFIVIYKLLRSHFVVEILLLDIFFGI